MRTKSASRARLVERALGLEQELLGEISPLDLEAWLELDLTMPQLKVLIDLARLGAVRVGRLASALGVSAATATGIVDRLARRRLVRRDEAEDDRRVTLVRLTPAGGRAVDQLFRASRDELRVLLDGVDEDRLPSVVEALEVLVASARERRRLRER